MALLTLLKSKIHRAMVTQTELEYEGSITIDKEIMQTVNVLPFERVHIYNINSGARFETYVIEGEAGNRDICLNGAAARMAQKGDRIIIVSYAMMDEKEASANVPQIVLLDEHNNPVVK